MRNWLRRIWRLRNPMISCLQAGGSGKPMVQFQSQPEACQPGAFCINPSLSTGKHGCPSSSNQAGSILPSPFCSVQAHSTLDGVRPLNNGEDSPLRSVYRFKCECLREASSQTYAEIMFNWISHGLGKLIHKLMHHRCIIFLTLMEKGPLCPTSSSVDLPVIKLAQSDP